MRKMSEQQVAAMARRVLEESERTGSLDTGDALEVLENIARIHAPARYEAQRALFFCSAVAWISCYVASVAYCVTAHLPVLVAILAGLLVPTVLMVFLAIGALFGNTETN